MKPARRVKIIISEDQLSLAIGKRGQNARLDLQADRLAGGHRTGSRRHQRLRRESGRGGGIAGGHSRDHARAGRCAGASWFDALEDLLQAEESDLAEIPQIGEQAAAILEAARAEAARRTLKVGETPVSG